MPELIAGHRTRDLFGGAAFPDVPESGPMLLTMGSRDFFWLEVEAGETAR